MTCIVPRVVEESSNHQLVDPPSSYSSQYVLGAAKSGIETILLSNENLDV